MEKEQIEFEEFLAIEKKLEIMIGLIEAVERVPKSKKLLKLSVMFGPEFGTNGCITRTAVTNIGDKVEPEILLGKKVPFITNLKPVTMMGIVSEAMIVVGTSPTGELEFERYSAGSKLL